MKNPNVHKLVKVERVIDETPTVRTLVVSDEILHDARPGQFCMVWIPGVAELPMSVMVMQEKSYAAFTVRKHGLASTALYNVPVGSSIGYRGPYGNSFDLRSGHVMLVGGGTGLVPLMRLITHLGADDKVTIIMGSKRKDEVLFEKTAQQLAGDRKCEIIIVTEDGSYGTKGLVTDAVNMHDPVKIAHDDSYKSCSKVVGDDPVCKMLMPTGTLYKAVDARPCFLTVNAAYDFSCITITLIGSSATPGIHTMQNCPGRASCSISSETTKVLTVGVSSITRSTFTSL